MNTSVKLTSDERDLVEQNLDIARIIVHRTRTLWTSMGFDYDDIFQIAAMSMALSVRKYDATRSKISTFFGRVALNAIRLEFRKSKCAKRKGNVVSLDANIPGTEEVSEFSYANILIDERAEASMYDQTLIRLAAKAIPELLSERQRNILFMTLEGLTQVEIAQAIGISQAQVSRSMKAIQSKFTEALL